MSQHENASRDRLNPVVFHGAVAGIVVFLIFTMTLTEQAGALFDAGLAWVNDTFGWYYMLAAVAYLVFVLVISLSRVGNIRLGPDHSRPEFSLLSWASMLFAAGIGIDLLFFCVAEPLSHYLTPPDMAPESAAALRQAVPQTFLHWGLTGWGMYVLMGMALAYFSYRHRLPLAIRSALYPLLGKRIYGPIGNAVDITAVISTVFGIATSLGIGVIQLNYGLTFMFGVPESLSTQVVLIVLVVILATISVVTGVEKGIRRLSEFNMLLAAALLLFVLFQGDTLHLLNALVLNVGDYLGGFVGKSFDTYAFAGSDAQQWKGWWTIFFWGWWIAWTPFVGLFLARISRGRTIRQFAMGALLIPLGFMMAWMSIFGNSGIDMVANDGLTVLGEQALATPQTTIYTFLEQYPYISITASVVTLLGVVFFVTSADSGALVLANFTSILRDVNHDAPIRLRIFWSAIIGLITIALLMAGGLDALQSAVVITALPFSLVMFAIMVGLTRALRTEKEKADARKLVAASGEGGNWKERLDRALDTSNRAGAESTIKHALRPGLAQFVEELERRGQTATLSEEQIDGEPLPRLTLQVDFDEMQSFVYQVRPHRMRTPSFLPADDDYYLRLDVHLAEGGLGQNLNGYTRGQVIDDVLGEYERHLQFLAIARQGTPTPAMPGFIGEPPEGATQDP
ncbi:choline BCCT transporter BetT [Halomonas denitrificans]|uniref:choline BCCT transporter BetT n=1 Tax=Halomonas TaxID=2745 RepID=UPI001A8DA89C|nr:MULTISPECIES: choline BCCT transporter BetT [Halomonas]MED5295316.1 choline BCCT transporter BetT [Pseudomonadota bacterium]MBN8411539.1 choline BCCT transporter BetT [Halomonas litopenaei]MBY5923948.1 choline BCCT transporter BetT [Halomonas sp. DP4Y7-2]MBY5928099.1 choline BCCT transporter BetT [Halomonas sp. DP8Y7-3]MBY5967354.1 choline BCCT transporter BetT [Halomonas denitrificans]